MPHREIHSHHFAGLWPPTWPMGLTMLRLLLLPVFLWLLLSDSPADENHRPHRWWALGVFAVMALTDKLDGYLARKLNQTTKIGTLLDPVADKLLVACSVILLSFPWVATPRYQIPFAVVIVIYAGYVIVALGTLALLSVLGRVSIAPRPLGKLNTVLQLLLVILTLLALDLGPARGIRLRPAIAALWWVVPIAAVLTCGDYLLHGVRQFRIVRNAPRPPAHG